jgi:xylulokinase
MTFLGIDLGTSALKAILVNDAQSAPATFAVPLRTLRPRPGWSEQDPLDWWSALDAAIRQLGVEAPNALRQVRALGLSGQMHGAVLLDRAGEALRPAILWNDSRARQECGLLQAAVPDLPRIAGIAAMPGFTAPKLLWLRRHEPDVFDRVWKVVSPKDYLRLRLSGEALTDMSDAAGTLWLDQAARGWSDEILATTGLARAHMPDLKEGSDQAGEVRRSLLSAWGIDGPVVIAGGAGDAAAAGIGIGAVEDGDAFISLGTSAQYFVTDDSYRPRPETLLHAFAHALPGRWFRMAAMLNGASCLEWIARIAGEADIEMLLDRTEGSFRGPSRALFLPYLAGERTPHNDPNARGVFAGLDPTTSTADLVQAVLEGVAFSLREAQELLDAAAVSPERVAVVGGGARSRFWVQLLAHILGRPLVRYAGSENGPAFGAARLARIALTGETARDVCRKPSVLDVLEPDLALTDAYAERFEAFKSLYRSLKNEFRLSAHDRSR